MKEVRVDSLSPGDFLAMPGSLPNPSNLEKTGTWLEGFLAGAWLKDGDYNAKDLRLHLNVKDRESFVAILDEMQLSHAVYNSSSSDQGIVIHVRDNTRAKMEAQGFIGDCYTKRVPPFVFHSSDEYVRGLLSGYFSTDGSFSGHVIEVSSSSKNLRDDIAHLLHRIGIHAFISQKTGIRGYRTYEGTDYFIYISAETDINIFENLIGFVQDYKAENLAQRPIVNADGYYVPLTEQVKIEMNAMRRRMWKQLHSRPYSFDYQASSVGLDILNKSLKFALPTWDCNPEDLSSEHFALTLKRAVNQDIRWIKVKSIEEIPRLPKEDFVYDLSIPNIGTEKFLAGACPLLVHNSEARMREAIAMAESVAPCLLWADEIDKGLSGIKSSNSSDGGTIARVFGTLLTSMEERMKNITVLATSNDIQALPPEFIRRFDEVFFMDLPEQTEREEIFAIHIKKRKRDPSKLNIELLAKKAKDLTGSEIEKIVKNGLVRAWYDGKREVKEQDFIDAIRETKPIAVVMKEQIDAIRKWADGRARYASSKAKNCDKAKSKRSKSITGSEESDRLLDALQSTDNKSSSSSSIDDLLD